MANPEIFANSFLPQVNHNPDVLSCLANLSNDEVFTPPNVANAMLDMLPQELFSNPEAKFLDPVCKSGVFLREITKRLMAGLEKQFPDMQKRLDHILHNQVYGIAITELTSLLSRRTLYCAKYPNCPFSISHFDNITGNIRYKSIKHTWKNGKCVYCGASQTQYDREEGLESHAYEFIHTDNPQEIFGDMKFDVIIGNPPYQLNVGVEKENYAIPIYHKFIEKAKKLCPNYLSMIIPARWYAGGRGLDEFRRDMLHDNRLEILHDFPNSTDCFNSVDIAGGICYFLWNNAYKNDCRIFSHKGENINSAFRPLLEKNCDTLIRHNEAIPILRKVTAFNENTFDKLVSAQTPFGFTSSFKNFKESKFENSIKYYTYGKVGYIDKSLIKRNHDLIDKHKLYISAAYGERGDYPFYFLGKPFYGEPKSCCSQSYLVIGPLNSKHEAKNIAKYISTKFFRFFIMLKKNAQHNMSYIFSLVPLQDFTKPWTDAELYTKYNLSQEEIDFIETMIKPMDLPADKDTESQDA